MTERGERLNDDEQRRQAYAWMQSQLAAWEVDPGLVASMSSDEVWAELEALGAAHEDIDALRTWINKQRRLGVAPHPTAPARGTASSTSSKDDRVPIRRRRRIRWIRRFAVAAAVLCIAYATLWGIGRVTRSPQTELARLRADDEPLSSLVVAAASLPSKGSPEADPSTWPSEIRAGTTALLHAQKTTFGLFPRYDPVQAALGVAVLERAYTALESSATDAKAGDLDALVSGKNRFSPGVVAFVIAKGYLMLDDPVSARAWLRRSIHHGQHAAADDATTLLEHLSDSSASP